MKNKEWKYKEENKRIRNEGKRSEKKTIPAIKRKINIGRNRNEEKERFKEKWK